MEFPFTLNQLRYFIEVAHSENMRVAAERLHVSQSTLSAAISQLEHALRLQLFVRRRDRTLVLSSAGKQFATEVLAFIDHAKLLSDHGSTLSAKLTGRLCVGVYAPIAPCRFPKVLTMFETKHPGVDVQLVVGNLREVRAALIAGDCEVGLMYSHGLGPGFSTQVLEVVQPHVFVSSGHRAAIHGSVHLSDFAKEPYIQLDLPYSLEYYNHLFQIVGITPIIRYIFNDYETVRSFAAMGHGYAVLNQHPVDMTYSGADLVALNLLDDLPSVEVVAVWPERSRLTRRAEAFLQICEEHYFTPKES